MIKVALTGGIGSGKTTVANIFQALGYPVYTSDTRASYLINHNDRIKNGLKTLFGESIYLSSGELDKKKLANLIFNNSELLQGVNSIVHPVVVDDFLQWSSQQDSLLIFFESAILFEANLTSDFDYVITITADQETRIQRAMKRDCVTREKIMERINHQIPDEEKCRQSDFIIYNNDSDHLLEQILEMVKKLKP